MPFNVTNRYARGLARCADMDGPSPMPYPGLKAGTIYLSPHVERGELPGLSIGLAAQAIIVRELRLFFLKFCLRLFNPWLKLGPDPGIQVNRILPVGNGFFVIFGDKIEHSLVKKILR